MKKIYALLLMFIMYSASGQDGSLIPEFSPPSNSIAYYAKENDTGNFIVVKINQTDFQFEGVGRINSDGTEDPNFTLDFIPSYVNGVHIIFVQSDGNILLGGSFTNYGTTGRKYLIRVSPTGDLDENFNPNIPAGFTFASIAENDDKIFIGGYSNSINVKPLYCLNKDDGSFDSSFMANLGTNATGWSNQWIAGVFAIKPLAGGEIIIGGSFNAINGVARKKIAKLNADGTLNNAALSGLDDNTIYAIETQTIGGIEKVLVSGSITHSSGSKFLLRLGTDLTLDTSFTSPDLSFSNSSVEPSIYSFKVQDSNKIVIGGSFTHVSSIDRSRIARLHPDGALDLCFDPGTGLDNPDASTNTYQFLQQVIVDTDQSILILGTFQYYDGTQLQSGGVAKVVGNSPLTNNVLANPDTANIVSGSGSTTIDILDNDLYYGGDATTSNVTITPSSSNPTVTGITFNAAAGTITVASTTVAGTYTFEYKICATTGCGGCSTTTVTITVTSASPTIITTSDTYSVTGCGAFTLSASVLANDTYNGQLFDTTTTSLVTVIKTSGYSEITISADGIVTINAAAVAGVYSIGYKVTENANPANFKTGSITVTIIGPVDAVNDTGTVTAGVGGVAVNAFTNDTYDCRPVLENSAVPVIVQYVTSTNPGVKINPETGEITVSSTVTPGTYELTYQLCDNNNIATNCDIATVTVIVASPPIVPGIRANSAVTLSGLQTSTGNIIIAGAFTAYNNFSVPYITRLKTNLTYDSSFLSTGPSPTISSGYDLDIHSPGDKIFITGNFNGYSGVATKGIAMLKSDGTYDTNFNVGGTGLNGNNPVGYSSDRQTDGKIVIVGSFTHYNTTPRNNIVRISSTGVVDSFTSGTAPFGSGIPFSVAINDNNQILVAGNFTTYQGANAKGIVRINQNTGQIDGAFAAASGTGFAGNLTVDAIKLQVLKDGTNRIMAYGNFTSYKGYARKNIVRIKNDGDIDMSFNPGSGFDDTVTSIIIEPDGKIIVGGIFTTYKGLPVKKIVRLLPDGTLDPSFSVGAGPTTPGSVLTLTRQPYDGKVIVGGSFYDFNGIPAYNITRIAPSVPGSQQRGLTVWESEPAIDTNLIMNPTSISIYPNPSEGLYNIEFKGYEEQSFDITIHNAIGQLIYQGKITSQDTNQIDLTRFESGSYYITMVNNSQMINKVVVKK